MPFTQDFRTPAQLTAAARAAFREFFERYLVSALLPIEPVYDLEFTYGAVEGPDPAAAVYRAFNTPSKPGEIPAGEVKVGKIPPISQNHPVDEYLKLSLYGQNDAIGDAFEQRAIRSARAVAARVILGAYEALATGAITINENGTNYSIAYGRAAGLTANASTAWSTVASADPIADLENFRNNVYKRPIGRVLVSNQVATYLQQNTQVKQQVLGRGSDLTNRVSWEDVRAVFRDWRLGELEVMDELVRNQSGSEVSPVAADKVLILPAGGAVGTTKVGIAAESINAENGIAESERPGLFAGAMHSSDPEGYKVLVSGIVIPALTEPDATGCIDAY